MTLSKTNMEPEKGNNENIYNKYHQKFLGSKLSVNLRVSEAPYLFPTLHRHGLPPCAICRLDGLLSRGHFIDGLGVVGIDDRHTAMMGPRHRIQGSRL